MAGEGTPLWPTGSGAEFRADIREVMELAMPEAASARPLFHFDQHRQFTSADSAGQPYDWTSNPASSNPKADAQVLCIVEPISGLGAGVSVDETPTGAFAGDRLKLYFFETEWAAVSDFTHVTLGIEGDDPGTKYERIRRLTIVALGDVQMYPVEVRTLDA